MKRLSLSEFRWKAVAILALVLIAASWVWHELTTFDPGAVYLETVKRAIGLRVAENIIHKNATAGSAAIERNDPSYGFSALNQARIALGYKRYLKSRNALPRSIGDLSAVGVDRAILIDPWNRAYKVRVTSARILIVQSTGPSGIDRISSEWLESSSLQSDPVLELVGDNLILLEQLSD
jgi:hypothetical protein